MAERYAVCVGSFYEDLSKRLVAGAMGAFESRGIGEGSVDVHEVPGAFELPLAALYCADHGYAGVVCLGAVIRGETDHYEFVCAEAARGIQEVQLRTHVPCGFGLLTVDDMDQALARTGGGRRDQGAAAADAVLRMHAMSKQLGARHAGSG